VTDEEYALTERMDGIDLELDEAERAGRIPEQIALLRERARAWREYGALLRKAGKENTGAELAALRDESNAAQLEGGAR
jgi:hypothetical protein